MSPKNKLIGLIQNPAAVLEIPDIGIKWSETSPSYINMNGHDHHDGMEVTYI